MSFYQYSKEMIVISFNKSNVAIHFVLCVSVLIHPCINVLHVFGLNLR